MPGVAIQAKGNHLNRQRCVGRGLPAQYSKAITGGTIVTFSNHQKKKRLEGTGKGGKGGFQVGAT